MKTYLEFHDEKSAKFWQIEVQGAKHIVRWGKIGTKGQSKEKEFAEQVAQRLAGVTCQVAAKVHEEDRLYGSVTARDIINALAAQGVEIEKRMLLLKEPIKQTGTFTIPVRVYKDIEPEITLKVVPEQ